MRCKHVQERLLDSYLAHEPGVPEGLAPHLEQCAKCRAEAAMLARGMNALQLIQGTPPPRDLKARVFERIALERTKESWSERLMATLRRPAVEWGLAAAVMFAAVGATTVVLGTRADRATEIRSLVDRGEALRISVTQRELLNKRYIDESPRFRAALSEAVLALDDMSAVGDDREGLVLIGQRIRANDLTRRLAQVAAQAPSEDRELINRIIHELEQLPTE